MRAAIAGVGGRGRIADGCAASPRRGPSGTLRREAPTAHDSASHCLMLVLQMCLNAGGANGMPSKNRRRRRKEQKKHGNPARVQQLFCLTSLRMFRIKVRLCNISCVSKLAKTLPHLTFTPTLVKLELEL